MEENKYILEFTAQWAPPGFYYKITIDSNNKITMP
jgi:hypothetical protein